MNDFDLTDFAAAVHDRAPGWESAGVLWQLTIGPARDKAAAWVTCEDAHRATKLTIWTSGEAELDLGDLASGTITSVHYDLANSEDLAACLDDLTQHFS
ncbi:hypothetical protein [Acrocarpospora macrocephala]|uniref:hypothetical protein n=1 Tax=Acrocarpospora macrocephala TaxID=150177 RepID=UPI0012D32ECE|nr:hypothetical protein [Acrocarpospora macrocephala]